MSLKLTFKQHEEFHRAALHMSCAGALGGLAGYLVLLTSPVVAGLVPSLPLAAIALGTALGACQPAQRTQLRRLGLLAVLLIAALSCLEFLERRGSEPSLGSAAFALLFGGMLAACREEKRWIAVLLAGAAASLVGRFVSASLLAVSPLPGWIAALGVGAAFGLVATLGIVPWHLELRQDRVGEVWETLQRRISGEQLSLAKRALEIWSRVERSFDAGTPARVAIEDSVLRLLDLAGRWQQVENGEADARSADHLVERMTEIEQRIGQASDPIAIKQYEQAKAAIVEQLRYVREIAASRERVVARMHHYLAAMERLRFAVINCRSADASRLASEVQPILADLESLKNDIDCTSEALGEMERSQSSPPDAKG
ncbi:MAG: hypothetical protein V2A73_09525 [Pseudomonadota bacterium]